LTVSHACDPRMHAPRTRNPEARVRENRKTESRKTYVIYNQLRNGRSAVCRKTPPSERAVHATTRGFYIAKSLLEDLGTPGVPRLPVRYLVYTKIPVRPRGAV
jgi:hypothetical protein